MVSLIIQQLYREILAVADENGGRLNNRVMMYLDEFGTFPKIESAEMMFSASRSRMVSIVPIIQSFAQLNQNYREHGAEIITDNTQLTIFGGFAPNSKSAEVLSKAMGSKTIMSGSVSRGKNDPSESLQMNERALMTPDELKSMPMGHFIVMKTGYHPMKVNLKLLFKWGIKFEEPFGLKEQSNRKVQYLSKAELESVINDENNCGMTDKEVIDQMHQGKILRHAPQAAPHGQSHTEEDTATEDTEKKNNDKKDKKKSNSKGGGQGMTENNTPTQRQDIVRSSI